MFHVAAVIIVAGVLLWLVTKYVPMNDIVKGILVAFVVICLVLYLLNVFGVLHNADVPVPRVR